MESTETKAFFTEVEQSMLMIVEGIEYINSRITKLANEIRGVTDEEIKEPIATRLQPNLPRAIAFKEMIGECSIFLKQIKKQLDRLHLIEHVEYKVPLRKNF